MIDRRHLFGAVAGVVVTGAVMQNVKAEESKNPRQIVTLKTIPIESSYEGMLDHIKHIIECSYGDWTEENGYSLNEETKNAIRLNELMISHAPHLFKANMYITAPASITFDTANNLEKHCIAVRSRMYDYRYNLELAQDLTAVLGLEHKEAILEKQIIEALAKELTEIQAEQLSRGMQMVHYAPVLPIRAVDQETYQPMIGFKIRYTEIPLSYIVGNYKGEV